MLFDVFCSGFAGFKLFGHLSHFGSWVLLKVSVAFINGFSNKLIICHEEPEIVPSEDSSCFCRVSHNGICANTALYHSSMLLLPC